MDTLNELISNAVSDFGKVAALAHAELSIDSIIVEIFRQPHRPPTSLPSGEIAVYTFFHNGRALKIGKVGPKSSARYTSQHYNPASAQSTLARSILVNAESVGAISIDHSTVGEWIRNHTDRVNLLLPASLGLPTLSLLESFLHVRWKPLFEGRLVGQ
jgi:hypothetical protein